MKSSSRASSGMGVPAGVAGAPLLSLLPPLSLLPLGVGTLAILGDASQ